MARFNKNYWMDESQEIWPSLPFQVIKADDPWYESTAELFSQQQTRRVSYKEDDGTRWSMELVLYKHPTGAADLTIGTQATATDGTVTYTPTQEGRLISETGVLVPTAGAPQNGEVVAGALFADYYTHFDDDYTNFDNGRVITIEEGDLLWVVRRGEFELDFSGAVTAGGHVVTSATVAGEVQAAAAIDTTTAITLHATLAEHLLQRGYKAIGTAMETLGGAGLGKVFLELPVRPANPQ